MILHGHSIHWRTVNSDRLEGLLIVTVLQLDRFCRKQGKWVEVAYVLPFCSLGGMPDLCPKGIDLSVKPSATSCLPTLSPYLGLQNEQTEIQGTSPGRVALVSVETQTEV